MTTTTSSLIRDALTKDRTAIRRALWSGVFVALSTIGLSGTSAWLIVRAAQHPVVLSLTVPMGLVQLFALSKAAGRYLERTQTHQAALSVMGTLRARLAITLQMLLPAGVGPKSSAVVESVLGDVERVQDLLTAVAGPLVTSALAGVVTVFVAMAVVPLAGVVLLGGLVLTGGAIGLVAAHIGGATEDQLQRSREALSAIFSSVAHAGEEFLLLGAEATLRKRVALLEDEFDVANARRASMIGALNALATLVSGVTVACVIALSAKAYQTHHVAQALIAVPALLSVTALELLGGIAPLLISLRRDRGAIARLEDLRRYPAPVRDVLTKEDPLGDDVESRGLGFAYGPTRVLRDISFVTSPGDVLLIRGASGEGKTTLAQLLVKFLEATSGDVLLGSKPYAELHADDVRRSVGFVDDEPHVFQTSLARNLRIANPLATDAQLLDALEVAGLSEFFASLDDGLDQALGGRTTGLSGGEQRRLGIARQVLAPQRTVILDEPTEGLDEETAHELLRRLTQRYRDGVLVLISHRELDAQFANRVFELHETRLRETFQRK